jgi:serine/threonine-protein kinase HipA
MSASRLAVELSGELVGVLEQRNGGSRFIPAPAWSTQPAGRRAVLGQRFEERPWTEVRAGQGLPDWFEHVLPEAGGPLRRAVARGLGVRETSSFVIAETVGRDLPGAMVLRPEAELAPGFASGRRVLKEEIAESPKLSKLRFSLAGIQLKFSARATERGLAVGYGGDQIVKLADQRFDHVPTNEYAVMTWARCCGIDVPSTGLMAADELVDLPEGLMLRDPMAFVIERYDRQPNGQRIHQEDFAQILGLSPYEGQRDKYEGTNLDSIARLVAALSPEDVDEFVRRVTFMVLSANNDMHAKNWSVVYPDKVQPRLAPAYDLLCTDLYLGTGVMAFKLAGVRRLDGVRPVKLERLAVRAGVDPARVRAVAAETVDRAVGEWPTVRDLAPGPVAEYLDSWLIRCPLVRGLGS